MVSTVTNSSIVTIAVSSLVPNASLLFDRLLENNENYESIVSDSTPI